MPRLLCILLIVIIVCLSNIQYAGESKGYEPVVFDTPPYTDYPLFLINPVVFQPPETTDSGIHIILPVTSGKLTAVMGATYEPLDNYYNKGIDIYVPIGTKVYAVWSGTVISSGWLNDGWGISVKIRDSDGRIHSYGHLSVVSVNKGEFVSTGTEIALSGNTGNSTGPHISYDIYLDNGTVIDPSPYVGFPASGDNRNSKILGIDISQLK